MAHTELDRLWDIGAWGELAHCGWDWGDVGAVCWVFGVERKDEVAWEEGKRKDYGRGIGTASFGWALVVG